MKLSIQDFENKKMMVVGLTGTGKTTLARFIAKKFIEKGKNVLVFSPHLHDWDSVDVYLYKTLYDKEDLENINKLLKKAKVYGKQGKLSLIVFDEFDMMLSNKSALSHELKDLIINHRHYNLSVMFISRRLQNIPTQIYEECHYYFVFRIQSPNAVKKLNDIDGELGEKAKQLDNYDFLFKKQGEGAVITRINLS